MLRIDRGEIMKWATLESAERVADILTESDRGVGDWTYYAEVSDVHGIAIRAYDETGEFVDYWRHNPPGFTVPLIQFC